MSKVGVPGGQVPLRTLQKRASDLQRQAGGSSCFRSWEHLGDKPPTKGQTKAFPRGDRTAGIMASVEQRPRADGGITARVVWRQDGQRMAEKFAVGRNPLLAAKRFKTLVEEAGNRWPEGWVPGQGFVTVETPSDSGHEPTPLLAFGLRYVEQLIIRPGQRARYRAQLKALAVLRLPSPTVPGTIYLPFGRNVEDVTPRTSGSGSHGEIGGSRRRPITTASCSASSPGPLRSTHSSRSTLVPRPLHHDPPSRRSSPSGPGSPKPSSRPSPTPSWLRTPATSCA